MTPKTSYYYLSFNFGGKKRFGDIDLAGKLNNADLCLLGHGRPPLACPLPGLLPQVDQTLDLAPENEGTAECSVIPQNRSSPAIYVTGSQSSGRDRQ